MLALAARLRLGGKIEEDESLSIDFYVFGGGWLAHVQTAAFDVALVFFTAFGYTSTIRACSLTLAS